MTQERSNYTRSIERALDILECFSEKNTELRIADICKSVGLSKSTVHRTMATMENRGYLSQSLENGKYRLGVKTLSAGKAFLAGLDFRALALPYMRTIRDTINESVNLYVTNGSKRVVIERLESDEPLRRVLKIGDELPLDRGAAGKVFLAFNPKLQEFAQIDPAVIAEIRRQHYAVSHGERESDAASVAVPLFDHQAKVIAVLAVSGPSIRFKEPQLSSYISILRESSEAISSALGCSPARLNALKAAG